MVNIYTNNNVLRDGTYARIFTPHKTGIAPKDTSDYVQCLLSFDHNSQRLHYHNFLRSLLPKARPLSSGGNVQIFWSEPHRVQFFIENEHCLGVISYFR